MKNTFIVWWFAFLSSAFAQLPSDKMSESYGEFHNAFCLKHYFSLNSVEDLQQRFPYYYELDKQYPVWRVREIMKFRFPNTGTYLQKIDTLIQISEKISYSEFMQKQRILTEEVRQASELTETEKSLLFYMLSVLKHSYQLWGRLLPNRKTRAVLTADAYGALKGILLGLLFFAIHDLSKQPTRIGVFGGIGLALTVPAVSSLIAGIKYKKGSEQYYYID